MNSTSPSDRLNEMSYRPLARIPERRSSILFRSTQSSSSPTDLSTRSTPSAKQPTPGPHVFRRQLAVTARGKSVSPIKRRSTVEEPIRTTFVPTVLPNDILQIPRLTHPRVQFDLHLLAPLFVGGATVEGEVHLQLDPYQHDAKKQSLPSLTVNRISATVVAVESCKGRREIFNALTTHVVHIDDLAIIADVIKPFSIDLPLRVGPPSCKSRKASISYLLSMLVEFRTGDETHFVRQTKEIDIITVHDPEQVLVNLANPLVAKDELQFADHFVQLTAALHRQTWIGGYLVFIDLNINNQTSKPIRRVDLQLEKLTMFYSTTGSAYKSPQSVSPVRIPEEMHKTTLVKRPVISAAEPILPKTASFRTAQLPLPANNVSITTARYFSITYTLCVKLVYSYTKSLKVSLPISLIHPNSIDVPPNALAQVTASLERARSKSRSGRAATPIQRFHRPASAFGAARRASQMQLRDKAYWAGKRVIGGTTDLPNVRTDNEPIRGRRATSTRHGHRHGRDIASPELDDLARVLERSPRRFAPIRLTETPGRPSIDVLANGTAGAGRPSFESSGIADRGRANHEGASPLRLSQARGDNDTQKIKIKRRRSVAAMLRKGSGDLDLSHFDGTGDQERKQRDRIRRGSKSLDLGSMKGSAFAEGGFDGGISERLWPVGDGDVHGNLGAGSQDHERKVQTTKMKDNAKPTKQKLKYRFPGSTEMAALGSDESISTRRPDDTPPSSPSPPPARRSIKHSRSVSFEDEADNSSSDDLGTVNRTPRRNGRVGLAERNLRQGRRPGLSALLPDKSGGNTSDQENQGRPILAARFGMGNKRNEDGGLGAAVRGKWRGRFLLK